MASNLTRGALYIVLSELLIALMSCVIRTVSGEVPNPVMVFFRSLFGLMALTPWLLRGPWPTFSGATVGLHLVRALSGVGAMYCFFYSVAHLPLAEATVLGLTAPFMIPVLAWLWLRERAPRPALLGVVVGFCGVLLVLRPGHAPISLAACTGLLGAFFAALARVSIRRLGPTESSVSIVLSFGVVGTLLTLAPLPAAWQTPSPQAFVWLGVLGALATCGQLLLTRAYSLAPAGQIGPFTYVSVVYATLLGWVLWGEVPHLATFGGMALIACAGVLCLLPARRVALPA